MSRLFTACVALGVVLASPALAPLCAAAETQSHSCCAAQSDCHLAGSSTQMRCCTAPPAKQSSGSERGVLDGPGTHAAMTAGSLPAMHAALVQPAAPEAALTAASDLLSTFRLPLRL